jgi:hypothetical protein
MRSLRHLLVPALVLLLGGCATGPLRPFTTDGCSVFPDGLPDHRDLWHQCCVTHDRSYWIGGTYAERKAADQALRTCVSQVNEPAIAEIMLRGVRVGGSPYLPFPFRWGYGWPYGRGYQAVTDEERAAAQKLPGTTP